MTDENTSPTHMPDEIHDVAKLAKEYMDRRGSIMNEIELLKDDLKALREEFEDKLDLKELDRVDKVLKIESQVKSKDTYDIIREALTTDTTEE